MERGRKAREKMQVANERGGKDDLEVQQGGEERRWGRTWKEGGIRQPTSRSARNRRGLPGRGVERRRRVRSARG